MAKRTGNKGLSLDLRKRVLAALEQEGLTYGEAARRFGIGRATVSRWKRLKRETGSLEPRPHGGGRKRAIRVEQEPIVEKLVLAHPDWTEEEYRNALRELGIEASRATVGRVIRSLGYTVKKRPSSLLSETKNTCAEDGSSISPPSTSTPFRVWFSWTKPAQTSR